ncbi:hypothetical protein [Absidia glauca]|uniref:Uncharacterized protein n=1 Tax=Absidia glauca TaxID=4829 RepID=A0A168PWE3_ABSGL|nr:hypothetical protein [Absidia glauca]
MKLAMFHSKRDGDKPTRKKAAHEPISKLTRLFNKLNTATHSHQYDHHSKHAISRASLTPFTKSASQLPMTARETSKDTDKLFEHRQYKESMQARRQTMGDSDKEDGDEYNNDDNPSASGRQEEGIPGCSLLNLPRNSDATSHLTQRPPLPSSPPSSNEILRPSHINSNRGSTNGLSKAHETTTFDPTIPAIIELLPTACSTLSTDISRSISQCHDNDLSCDSGLHSNDDNGENHGKHTDAHASPKNEDQPSPILDSRQLQIWDSAFWNDNKSEQSTLLNRKISAPPPIRRQQHHQDHVPPVLHELRRINTISNDDLHKQQHRYHHHQRQQQQSLQRNHSYVVKKGRFEISIETTDPGHTEATTTGNSVSSKQ